MFQNKQHCAKLYTWIIRKHAQPPMARQFRINELKKQVKSASKPSA